MTFHPFTQLPNYEQHKTYILSPYIYRSTLKKRPGIRLTKVFLSFKSSTKRLHPNPKWNIHYSILKFTSMTMPISRMMCLMTKTTIHSTDRFPTIHSMFKLNIKSMMFAKRNNLTKKKANSNPSEESDFMYRLQPPKRKNVPSQVSFLTRLPCETPTINGYPVTFAITAPFNGTKCWSI